MSLLDELLGGLPQATFYAEHFERAPLHVSSRVTERSLPVDELNALIRATAEANPRRLRANVNGAVLVPPRNASPAALAAWAHEVHANGATLIINYIERLDLRWAEFAKELGAALGAQVTLTVFATPPAAQGFPPHFDTLDVFVLQLEGAKTWSLGDSAVQLPTLRQGYIVKYEGRPRVRQTVKLATGNLLYIPRGVVHWAGTTEERSVHITADIDTATAGDVLSTSVREAFGRSAPEPLLGVDGWPTEGRADALRERLSSIGEVSALIERAQQKKWARQR
ncbi:MAG: hypothetical protein HOW73_44670 [Polyangiaceae bacterium]|nr:hypothetical protein [Polyangiaceae bacterium]